MKKLLPPIQSSVNFDNFGAVTIDVPRVCPYCSYANKPKLLSKSEPFQISEIVAENTQSFAFIAFFEADCCNKIFFCCYRLDKTSYRQATTQMLYMRPEISPFDFDPVIEEISPRGFSLAKEIYQAANRNHFEIATIGFRTLLEILTKDYAIKLLGLPQEEVSKKSLRDCIDSYLSDSRELFNSSDLVRLIGNDKVHYIEKYELSFEELEFYMSFVIDEIVRRYYLRHPPVSRPSKN